MKRPGLTKERLIAIFALGVMAFTPPFLSIFNTPGMVAGIPRLYAYLFGAWAVLIALVALAVRHTGSDLPLIEPESPPPDRRAGE